MSGYSRLARNSAARKALLRDLITDLILNGSIQTTVTKANELKIIPNDFAVTDYTQPITRENFCILAVKMIETKIGEELATENPQFPLGISDINNENVDKLYAAGIINGKEQKKFR